LVLLRERRRLPPGGWAGEFAEPTAQPYPLTTRVGGARSDGKADFWNAIGGPFKAPIVYLVTLSCDAGVTVQRGPEVTRREIATRRLGAVRNVVEAMQRVDGIL